MGGEFRSRLEELVGGEVKELRFPSSAGFRPFQRFFCEEAVAHPAKANLYLLYFLIKRYTREGDVVADIMAGTGSMGIVASYLGRHSILIELESKFVKWIMKNVKLLEKYGKKKGEIDVFQGDARKLTDLLGVKTDTIITSPPYSESLQNEHDYDKEYSHPRKSGRPIGLGKSQVHTLYSRDKNNIGNLSHGEIDAVITSPPYVETRPFHDLDFMLKIAEDQAERARRGTSRRHYATPEAERRHKEKLKEGTLTSPQNIANLHHGSIDAVITSLPYAESAQDSEKSPCITKPPRMGDVRRSPRKPPINRYSQSKENIGNLPFVDSIITSPPYEGSYLSGGDSEARKKRLIEAGHDPKDFLGGKARNAVLKHYDEVDAIITSPPYSTAQKGGGIAVKGHFNDPKLADRSYQPKTHGENSENIGNLPHGEIDAVITSPPYEGSLEGTSRHTKGGIASRDPALAQTETYSTVLSFGVPVGYSPNKDNIGNLKSSDEEYEKLEKVQNLKSKGKETYLEAMLRVYRECYNALKPGGRIIIIVKPFIRNKKVVDLPWHTWLLLRRCGFRLVEVLKFRLPTASFWRILYFKKHPEVERINHEYIIIACK